MTKSETKLTLSDCYKYYNAEIKIGDIIVLNIYGLIINNIERPAKYLFENYDCKLILRNLSQLTFEEKLYIYDIFCNNYEEDKALLKDTFDNFMEILAYCGTENAVDLADYLRSKSIMIEKPDWFEIGKAVKE